MAKKKNIFQRYFENFGLKQICDILMLIALVVLIVGWIICETTQIVLYVAFGLFILTALLGIIKCIVTIQTFARKACGNRQYRHNRGYIGSCYIRTCVRAYGRIFGTRTIIFGHERERLLSFCRN